MSSGEGSPAGEARHRHNLPLAATSFIGRRRETADIERLLAGHRLVTLTGTGGIGKTRLALRVADDLLSEYADGVYFVDLSPLADPALVPEVVAAALGIRERSSQPLSATLTAYLHSKQALIVLDNCEHLVAACATLAEHLLRACPSLRLLVTSREMLNIPGEVARRVPPLPLPAPEPSAGHPEDAEAVQLFLERARAVRPDLAIGHQALPAIIRICRELEGVPLAIELAAARVGVLTVEEIAARLGDRFRLLTAGGRTAPPRHQALRALIDWSFDLLPEPERALLRCLSVFAGGWTIEAAEAVCAGDGIEREAVLDLLTALVRKSLVLATQQDDRSRYALAETLREYAAEKLCEVGEETEARDRHAAWFRDLAEQHEPRLRGAEQQACLAQLEMERDNLRTALDWSLARRAGAEDSLRLAGALHWLWFMRGYFTEGRRWLERALAASAETAALQGAAATARAKVLFGAGRLAHYQGDYARAAELLEESLTRFRELGEAAPSAGALRELGHVALDRGDYSRARALCEESLRLAREAGDAWRAAFALVILGRVARAQGEIDEAVSLFEQAVALSREHTDTWGTAWSLYYLGLVLRERGDGERAAQLLDRSLALAREIDDRHGVALALVGLANVAAASGDLGRAASLLEQSLVLNRDLGDRWGIARCLRRLSSVLRARGHTESAARLLGAATALRAALGAPPTPTGLASQERELAALRARLGDDAFGLAWSEGQAMSPEEAVAYALAEGQRAAALGDRPEQRPTDPELARFTEREREVVALIAHGCSNREIANELTLSVRTVERHIENVYAKLGVSGKAARAAATAFALRHGLA